MIYTYHHFEYEAPARLNIFSNTKGYSMSSQNLNVTCVHDLMKNRRDYREITRDPVDMQIIAMHDYSISYNLPERNGTYEITI